MDQQSYFSVYNASAGSGKTFTLVKEYLKIILSSESVYHFQKILAITFTNKAAAEMKLRILENLRAFAEGDSNDMLSLLSEELNVAPEVLTEKSQRIVSCILQNYSAFNITTIDSFTHKLIRTFAYDLGLPLNFEVEMNASKLISEAVDVLISKLGVDEELTSVLIAFAMQKVTEDKSWDVTLELNSIAKLLLNEDDRLQFQRLEKHSLGDFIALSDRLKKAKVQVEKKIAELLERANKLIESVGLGYEHLHIDFKSFLNRLN
ncbi:MAG: UvrD-helicase domain-containing protein, partial [Flavicella sp.]